MIAIVGDAPSSVTAVTQVSTACLRASYVTQPDWSTPVNVHAAKYMPHVSVKHTKQVWLLSDKQPMHLFKLMRKVLLLPRSSVNGHQPPTCSTVPACKVKLQFI